MTKLEQQWRKTEKWQQLQQVLDLPIVREALTIVESDAMPDTAGDLVLIGSMPAAEAAFHTARVHFTQSGVATAIARLRSLAAVPKAPKEVEQTEQEPFAHITKDNAEEYLQRS